MSGLHEKSLCDSFIKELYEEEAIANEVGARLNALSALCDYVGWQNVSKHLLQARTELTSVLRKEGLPPDSCIADAPINV